MVLIVNTTSDLVITQKIKELADSKGIEYEIIEAGSLKISPCIGCNYCWLKTPGECSIKDDYEIILKRLIHSDQMWVISGTTLGFLDHKGKNVFDRILPIMTMFLEFKNRQMRHVPRYSTKTDIGIIYTGEADKEYLKRWNERVTINLGSTALGAYKFDELKEAVSCMC